METTTPTVRDIALQNPASIRVFEQFGIDYCCGGRQPLEAACEARNIKVQDVLAALEAASGGQKPEANEWTRASLSALIQHILEAHHEYIRRELPRLYELAAKVVRRHGDDKPEVSLIQAKVGQIGEELTSHLGKEEMILFPYISGLERSLAQGTPVPHNCFGTVSNPIAMMMHEHDAAGTLIADIRTLSNDFTPPAGACPTFHAFYQGLHEFEQNLHQHVHLENNILFPRAISLEASAA